jgi:hypothetical protein
MARTLPDWIEVRRDQVSQSWSLLCRACGIREHYHDFWIASRAASGHADSHHQEQDEQRAPG